MPDRSFPPSVDELFLKAAAMPPHLRQSYLRRACGGDDALRDQVESLLRADAAAGGDQFLGSALFGKSLPADSPVDRTPDDDSTELPRELGGRSSPDQEGERFRIIEKHRRGGLGEVLIALDRQLNREVAIKQIQSRWRHQDEARQRFLLEAEITGRLEHPGVVPVYAKGTWGDGREYYAMRFIEGRTLREAIEIYRQSREASTAESEPLEKKDDGEVLDLRQLLTRFVDVCNTIQYAHSRRIIHRDLKPSNIMVGPYGETLVVDWGLAKFLDMPSDSSLTFQMLQERIDGDSDSTPTAAGGAVGTPQYMSPEQAAGDLDAIGPHTDIYLLGATLYHILTGKPPNRESSLSKLLRKAREGVVVRPREVDPTVAPALESICLKAMDPTPGARYASAASLAIDVERWMADEPVQVHRDGFAVRLARWGRRHRTMASTAAVALGLIAVGSVAGSLLYNHQRQEQMKVEYDRNLKQRQLVSAREQRLAELSASVVGAEQLAAEETRLGRFSSALGFLQGALDSLSDEPRLAPIRRRVEQKQQRMAKLVRFERAGERAQRENFLSRDTQAILACRSALDALGVWKFRDWWNHLPDQDLSPEQRDALMWQTYQRLVLLDGLLIKRMGVVVAGEERLSVGRLLSGFIGTDRGMPEAKAAIVVSDHIHAFRIAESARWYRGMATSRLRRSLKHRVDDLELARNAPDAQALGVLSLIADQDPAFGYFFKGYRGDDALQAARDYFTRSIVDRPDHYWTQLLHGHSEYLLMRRELKESRGGAASLDAQQFEPILRTFGQCIAMRPDQCFAYADRASIFRYHAEDLSRTGGGAVHWLDFQDLLRRSLADAERASQLGDTQPWVDWHYGLALQAVGQAQQAYDRFLRASLRTLLMPMGRDQNRLLIRVDDLRGRLEVIQLLRRLLNKTPDRVDLLTLYASIRLNQGGFRDAIEAATRAINLSDTPAHAYAVRGMAYLQSGRGQEAPADFERCLEMQPNHVWACYGAAIFAESDEDHDRALSLYQTAADHAGTDDQAAAALLGTARALAALERYSEAESAALKALKATPSVDLTVLLNPLRNRRARRQQNKREGVPAELDRLIAVIDQLNDASATVIEEVESADSARMALLNGGFELELRKYWGDSTGPTWATFGQHQSQASRTYDQPHEGDACLHIKGPAYSSDGPSEGYGSMGQSFPVQTGLTYRIRLWVRGDSLAADAVQVQADDGTTIVSLPSGTYEWTPVEGLLSVDSKSRSGTGGYVRARVNLVCRGPGEAWLDDLQVLRMPSTKETQN